MASWSIGRRGHAVSPVVRRAAHGLAIGRVALGAAFLTAPGPTSRRWLGTVGEDDGGRAIAVRGLGARDLVLGLGSLAALRSGGDARQAARWVEAGILADLADGASTLLAGTGDAAREDGASARSVSAAIAFGAAAWGLAIRAGLR